MNYQDSMDTDMWTYPKGTVSQRYNMPEFGCSLCNVPEMYITTNPGIYPEIYYKLQPFVVRECDRMDMYGNMMPTQNMIEDMSEEIYKDAVKMYPEMEEEAEQAEMDKEVIMQYPQDDPPAVPVQFTPFFPERHRRRRRLSFRDLIRILLLNELFRRRRRR